MKKLRNRISSGIMTTLIAIAAISVVACSGGEKGSDQSAETEEEIEAARMDGRMTARNFINREWTDTVMLQHELLHAKSIQSKYLLEGKKRCAAAFDTAFIHTIRTVNPSLARELQ